MIYVVDVIYIVDLIYVVDVDGNIICIIDIDEKMSLSVEWGKIDRSKDLFKQYNRK